MRWTIPNILTLARIALVPVFLFFISHYQDHYMLLASCFVFLTAAVTDFFDGRIARLYDQRSNFGKFADPLADKLLVASALLAFSQIPETGIPLWLILLMLGREVLITLLRVFAIRRQTTMETSSLGKYKTATQMITVVLTLLILIIQSSLIQGLAPNQLLDYSLANEFWPWITGGSIWGWLLARLPLLLASLSTAISLISGFAYLWVNRKLFKRA